MGGKGYRYNRIEGKCIKIWLKGNYSNDDDVNRKSNDDNNDDSDKITLQ